MKKPNPLLAKYEALYEAKYRERLHIGMQMGVDAAIIAANEVLGMGPGRAQKFANAYIDTVNEMAALFVEDGKDDPEMVYSKKVLDDRIRSILGEDHFVPWNQRYGGV